VYHSLPFTHTPIRKPTQAQLQLKEIGVSFLDFFDSVHDTNCSIAEVIRPMRLNITTMTVCGTLDGDVKFLQFMKVRREPGWNQAKCCRLVELAESSEFFNLTPSRFSKTALQMKAKTLSASIKIFHKGAFHITGVKSQPELLGVLDEACRLISSVDASTATAVQSFETAMINVSVATTTGFNLENLLTISNEMNDVYAEMPERPPSCNIHITVDDGAHVTCMVYKSGKIIMSGKTPQRLALAYRTLMKTIMNDNIQQVIVPRTVDAVRRATIRFHWTELLQCALPGLAHTHGPCKTRVVGCEYCRIFGNVFAPSTVTAA
jgi:TATA-box binding protein (TBP) (component of TFIID and TFIIIB)